MFELELCGDIGEKKSIGGGEREAGGETERWGLEESRVEDQVKLMAPEGSSRGKEGVFVVLN